MQLDVERPADPRNRRLARELAEELGHEMRVGDLAFAAENIFDGNGIQHEIGLYYHVAWLAGSTRPATGKRDGTHVPLDGGRMLGSARFEPTGLIHILQMTQMLSGTF